MNAYEPDFLERGRLIQLCADNTKVAPDLFKPDQIVGKNLPLQLDMLTTRLSHHLRDTLGYEAASRLDSSQTGVEDTTTALNGVIRKLNERAPSMPVAERVLVARRSYPVLVRYALDQLLGASDTASGVADSTFTNWIPVEHLDYNETPLPHVSVKNTATVQGLKMQCPAFVSRAGKLPRLPQQMWHGMICIYEVCGEFLPLPTAAPSDVSV